MWTKHRRRVCFAERCYAQAKHPWRVTCTNQWRNNNHWWRVTSTKQTKKAISFLFLINYFLCVFVILPWHWSFEIRNVEQSWFSANIVKMLSFTLIKIECRRDCHILQKQKQNDLKMYWLRYNKLVVIFCARGVLQTRLVAKSQQLNPPTPQKKVFAHVCCYCY